MEVVAPGLEVEEEVVPVILFVVVASECRYCRYCNNKIFDLVAVGMVVYPYCSIHKRALHWDQLSNSCDSWTVFDRSPYQTELFPVDGVFPVLKEDKTDGL